MKYLKMLGLFAVTAVAMMGFTGNASATLTSAPVYTGEFDASAESSLLLQAGLEVTCTESTVKGEITSNTTNHASGPLSALSFGNCNGTVHTLELGSMTITGDELIAIGSKVTVERFGVTCTYGGGAGTKIGTLTNTTNAKSEDTVTLDVNANLPKQAGGAFCTNTGVWSGSYILTNRHPSFLDFDDDPVSASFTSPTGTEYTGDFDMSAESSLLFKANLEVTCTESTIKGNIPSNTTNHWSGQLTSLSFSGCNATVHTLEVGSLTIAGDELYAIGSKWTMERFGISCTYGGGMGTRSGTLTNTTLNGKDAVTLDVNANLPKLEGGAFCANIGAWSGSYVFTTPVENYLDVT